MLRPRGVDLHFEVELAVILGREVRDFMEDGGIGNGNGNGNGNGGGGGRWMDFIDCRCAFCVFCVFSLFYIFKEMLFGLALMSSGGGGGGGGGFFLAFFSQPVEKE